MEHNDQHDTVNNNVRERLLFPILLSVAALVITVVLIVVIGEFLLLFGHDYLTIGGEHVVPQVFVALGLALICLVGFAIAAARLAPDDDDSH